MKKIAAFLLIIAYVPTIIMDGVELMYNYDIELSTLRHVLNSMYAILIASGVALYSLAELIKTKKLILIPFTLLFIFIAIIYAVEICFPGAFENYYILAIATLTIILCFILYFIFSYLYQHKQLHKQSYK